MPDDVTLIEVYYRFAKEHGVYLDTILCDPELRNAFLDEVRSEVGPISERELFKQ